MSPSAVRNKPCMLLKADFFPLTVMHINTTCIHSLKTALEEATTKAPLYFTHSPVVIDTQSIDTTHTALDLEQLCQTIRDCKMIPVGVRGIKPSEQKQAHALHLAVLSNTPKSTLKKASPAEPTTPKKPPTVTGTKVITKAVRSGTQVYAENSDLIIMAAVNAGAECIADGNIHIYGPLRGRALAGAKGNTQANIFCEKLDAELISIAGRYLVKEDISHPKTKKPMLRIHLADDQLNIEGI